MGTRRQGERTAAARLQGALRSQRTICAAASLAFIALATAIPAVPQAFALSKHVYSSSFAGSGSNALSEPTEIALDQSSGDVYVADPVNHRVEKFNPEGQFILMVGGGVNKAKVAAAAEPGNPHHISEAEENVCDAGEECQSATAGASPGAFESSSTLYLAVDNSPGGEGDVYVGDPGDYLVSKFNSSGEPIESWGENGPGGKPNGQLAGREATIGDFQGVPPEFPSPMNGIGVGQHGTLFVLAGVDFQLMQFDQNGGFLTSEYFGGSGPILAGPGEDIFFKTAKGVPSFHPRYQFRHGEKLLIDNGIPQYEIVGGIPAAAAGVSFDPHSHAFYATEGRTVSQFSPACTSELESCIPIETFGYEELNGPQGVVVNSKSGTVYVADTGDHRVAVFSAVPYLPEAAPSGEGETPTEELLKGEVDPAGAGEITGCHFEYAPESAFEGGGGWTEAAAAECSPKPPYPGLKDVTAAADELTYGTTYRLRLLAENSTGTTTSFTENFTTLPLPAEISSELVEETYAETVQVRALINPGGGKTTFRVEYVSEEEFKRSEFEHAKASPNHEAGSARTPQSLIAPLGGLTPGTTYRYRVVAENANKTTTGNIQSFTTLPFGPGSETCANSHVRQQTSSAGLLDCRAYELVSAANSGGYDVESNLIAGQTPYAGYPETEGRVLYGVHGGGIPGTNHPTDRGVDPYLATRTEHGWSTEYVGIPANATPSTVPFASTLLEASSGLDAFLFGGNSICSPCFADGSSGEPFRQPNGELIQGMAGSLDPGPNTEPAGYFAKHLSANGEHLLFGSTEKFEPDGEEGKISIYDRNLNTEATQVVSKAPGGGNLSCTINCQTDGIGALGISKDGSHILLGQLVSESEGAKYWHLYMNVADSNESVDLTPGATEGVLFDGMTSDGSKVFFSSAEHLTHQDTEHNGADIYKWEAGHPLTLITKGESEGPGAPGNVSSCDPVANSAHAHWNTTGSEETCGDVAIGGGGGVAESSGTFYFLSPEKLDGSSGVQNAPNLYIASPNDGYAPHFVATLESVLNGPQPPVYTRSFLHDFQPAFTDATGLAVDHASHDVYVLDDKTDTVEKFDASGKPVDFTQGPGAGTNQLSGAETPAESFAELAESPFNFPTQLAVDNSTKSSQGDFYVPDVLHEVVDRFSSSGAYEGQIKISFPAGVAVDPQDASVYVSGLLSGVNEFEPTQFALEANAVTTPKLNFAAGNPTSIAVDSHGAIYLTQFGGGTEVYSPSGTFERTLDSNPSQSVSADLSSGEVAVDEGNQISEFAPSGEQLGSFGAGDLSDSVGVAVDAEGNLYATTEDGSRVAAFGPFGLPPGPSIDNPAVLDSVSEPAAQHTADFQLTPSGRYAAFPSTLALAGNAGQTAGRTDVYRYDASTEKLECVSCNPSGAPSSSEASLAQNGLSLTDDGRVFFNTDDALVLADTDNRQDVYEWEEKGVGSCEESSSAFDKSTGACLALISAGTSAFDSGLLGVDANGVDAYFFTRDSLSPQDKNGPTMKIYDAREGGGLAYMPPRSECKASDECHGAASPAPGQLEVGSEAGTPNSYKEESKPRTCRRGFALKHGRCVKKHPKKHHKSKKRQRRRSALTAARRGR